MNGRELLPDALTSLTLRLSSNAWVLSRSRSKTPDALTSRSVLSPSTFPVPLTAAGPAATLKASTAKLSFSRSAPETTAVSFSAYGTSSSTPASFISGAHSASTAPAMPLTAMDSHRISSALNSASAKGTSAAILSCLTDLKSSVGNSAEASTEHVANSIGFSAATFTSVPSIRAFTAKPPSLSLQPPRRASFPSAFGSAPRSSTCPKAACNAPRSAFPVASPLSRLPFTANVAGAELKVSTALSSSHAVDMFPFNPKETGKSILSGLPSSIASAPSARNIANNFAPPASPAASASNKTFAFRSVIPSRSFRVSGSCAATAAISSSPVADSTPSGEPPSAKPISLPDAFIIAKGESNDIARISTTSAPSSMSTSTEAASHPGLSFPSAPPSNRTPFVPRAPFNLKGAPSARPASKRKSAFPAAMRGRAASTGKNASRAARSTAGTTTSTSNAIASGSPMNSLSDATCALAENLSEPTDAAPAICGKPLSTDASSAPSYPFSVTPASIPSMRTAGDPSTCASTEPFTITSLPNKSMNEERSVSLPDASPDG